MERLCRKCGNFIPWNVTIEGKSFSLQNRKYCLECSYFRGHNTKADIDKKSRSRDGLYSEEEKKATKTYNYRKGWRRKIELIKIKGGKCERCGYSRCLRAMTFHHVDPSTKCFGLSMNVIWSKSWDKILEEANKCQLLCCRCHAETEEDIIYSKDSEYREILEIVLSGKVEPVKLKLPKNFCSCGKEIDKKAERCLDCYHLSNRKVPRPDKDTLLKQVEEFGFCEVGRMYGVSDNAIRKWIKSFSSCEKKSVDTPIEVY